MAPLIWRGHSFALNFKSGYRASAREPHGRGKLTLKIGW